MLPGFYQQGSSSTKGIELHFATGGIILLLGSIQLVEATKVRYPAFRHWVGRVYVTCCLLAAAGGYWST